MVADAWTHLLLQQCNLHSVFVSSVQCNGEWIVQATTLKPLEVSHSIAMCLCHTPLSRCRSIVACPICRSNKLSPSFVMVIHLSFNRTIVLSHARSSARSPHDGSLDRLVTYSTVRSIVRFIGRLIGRMVHCSCVRPIVCFCTIELCVCVFKISVCVCVCVCVCVSRVNSSSQYSEKNVST